MRRLWIRLRWLARRRRHEDEIRAELAFHLDEEEEELRAAGMTEAQARRAARRDLGRARDQRSVLIAPQRCRLTGRPGDHKAVRSGIDVKLDQARKGRLIDAIRRIERGNKSDQGAIEHAKSSP